VSRARYCDGELLDTLSVRVVSGYDGDYVLGCVLRDTRSIEMLMYAHRFTITPHSGRARPVSAH
jgi:hypothetical protein